MRLVSIRKLFPKDDQKKVFLSNDHNNLFNGCNFYLLNLFPYITNAKTINQIGRKALTDLYTNCSRVVQKTSTNFHFCGKTFAFYSCWPFAVQLPLSWTTKGLEIDFSSTLKPDEDVKRRNAFNRDDSRKRLYDRLYFQYFLNEYI